MAEKTTANSYDPEVAQKCLSEWDEAQDALDQQHMDYMQARAKLYKTRNAVLDRAKKAGIPKKTMKHVIKARDLQVKLDEMDEDLEGEELDAVENLRQALGLYADTPLGQAAQEAAE